jgi:hypothetical protein
MTKKEVSKKIVRAIRQRDLKRLFWIIEKGYKKIGQEAVKPILEGLVKFPRLNRLTKDDYEFLLSIEWLLR